ncbi:MAG: hypothetical protein E7230_01435 [Clostridiales bacterium]|nr:hypothetical protein [Clostridiales bacterium]
MGKYGAGSPQWNRVKEVMILKLGEDPSVAEKVDMRAFSIMDLMRASTINELPEDWRAFAEECGRETDWILE